MLHIPAVRRARIISGGSRPCGLCTVGLCSISKIYENARDVVMGRNHFASNWVGFYSNIKLRGHFYACTELWHEIYWVCTENQPLGQICSCQTSDFFLKWVSQQPACSDSSMTCTGKSIRNEVYYLFFKYPPNSASDIWFKKTASDYFIYSEMVLVHLNLKERTFTFALFQELGSLCPLPQPPSLRIQYLTLLLTSTPRAYLFL